MKGFSMNKVLGTIKKKSTSGAAILEPSPVEIFADRSDRRSRRHTSGPRERYPRDYRYALCGMINPRRRRCVKHAFANGALQKQFCLSVGSASVRRHD